MMKKKILVTYKLPAEGFSKILETNNFELIFPKEKAFSREEIFDKIKDVDVLLSMFNLKVDAEMIDQGKQLKIISNFGVGFNNIDIKYAKSKNIVVTNTPDPVIEPTAELAFALMANLARRISECDKKLRIPGATRWGVLENLGNGLYGKRIGIIGMGRIGQSIAKRALAAGMTICYNNRHQLDKATEEKYNAQYVSFDELIAKSEYISISTPLTEETHHLIDKDAFAKMRRDVNIVNTARGAIIKEKDLAEALTTKRIAGAALDVYEFEPQITQELLSLDNVVMVPHIGTATISARNEISKYACENIMRFFKGEKPLSRVI